MYGIAAALCLTAALVSAAPQSKTRAAQKAAKPAPAARALDKNVLEKYLRHLFLWGPQISVKVGDPQPSALPGFVDVTVVASLGNASQTETFLVSKDGSHVVRGTVYAANANPFAEDLGKLRTDSAPALGPAGAPVQLVIFSDFQCSFCRQAAKTLREQVLPVFGSDVRMVFKDFPLDAIHPWARRAATAGRCIAKQKPEAFWKFHDWIFENQGSITAENVSAKVAEFASGQGLDAARIGACLDDKAVAAEVERSIAEGRALALNSTPTLFINGRRVVGSVAPEQLKSIIEYERTYAREHGSACCSAPAKGGSAQ